MALWSVRRPLYKVGLMVQHLGLLLFLVGFSTPFWFHASPREGSQGLWHYCNGQCHRLQVEEEWFEVVRVCLCLTLIVYLMACVLAVYGNCLKKYDPLTYKHSRRIEITTAAAGLLGSVSMAVYTIMMKVNYQEYVHSSFGSAYGVTMGGCVLALLAAALLCATARPLQQTHVTLAIPVRQPSVMTYRSTSPSHTTPATPQSPFFAEAGTPAPAWNPPPTPPPYKLPSYMPHQHPPHARGCGYGFPTEFSNPVYPTFSSSSSSSALPPSYPCPNPTGPAPGTRPPPYNIHPSVPSAPSAFLD